MSYGEEHRKILEYFYDKTGIHFDEKKDIVANKIDLFYHYRRFCNAAAFFEALKSDVSLWQEFVNLLTVNETYFFRETRQLDILAEALKNREGVDMLCAPCSSGEEPYTILISLAEAAMLGKVRKLVGIDINSSVIEKAKIGEYPKRSFHRTPQAVVDRYFRQGGDDCFCINSEIKNRAEFKIFNIFDPNIKALGSFDVVFSRNMIIYFDKNSRLEAEKILYTLLKPGGLLFLGHADIIPNSFNLKKFTEGGIVYYQKERD